MKIPDLTKLSYRSMVSYPLRSVLSILGILVGIVSVVLMTSIGEGIHRYVLNEFTQFGTNIIAVTPGKTSTFGLSGATISNVRPLSLNDANALKRLDNIIDVVPLVQGNASVEYGRKSRRVNVLGVGSAVPVVWKMPVSTGNFLPRDHNETARPFAVLGKKLRDELFADISPLGQRIRIGSDRYRVIGVMEGKGQMLGFDMDDTVYIPTARAMELFNRESLMEIDLLYKAGFSVDHISTSIKRLLISRHGREDFTIITQQQMLELLDSVMDILTLAVAALGGISLLVGAVGILTIMIIAVNERIAEIGLLRALGAEKADIRNLFLAESVFLSFAGGVLGAITGMVLIQATRMVAPELPIKIAWGYIIAAIGISLIIGLLAGVMPALRAARLLPLDALRTE